MSGTHHLTHDSIARWPAITPADVELIKFCTVCGQSLVQMTAGGYDRATGAPANRLLLACPQGHDGYRIGDAPQTT